MENERSAPVTLNLSGRLCIGFGVIMAGVAVGVATTRQLEIWPTLLLGLVFGAVSGGAPYLTSRRHWKPRSLELLFFVSFIGSGLLGGSFWINQGISSYLTVLSCATAVVNLIGFVIAVRSR